MALEPVKGWKCPACGKPAKYGFCNSECAAKFNAKKTMVKFTCLECGAGSERDESVQRKLHIDMGACADTCDACMKKWRHE